MSRVTPDEKTLAMLAGIRERAEICKAKGEVVGYFQPISQNLLRGELDLDGRSLREIFADWLKRS